MATWLQKALKQQVLHLMDHKLWCVFFSLIGLNPNSLHLYGMSQLIVHTLNNTQKAFGHLFTISLHFFILTLFNAIMLFSSICSTLQCQLFYVTQIFANFSSGIFFRNNWKVCYIVFSFQWTLDFPFILFVSQHFPRSILYPLLCVFVIVAAFDKSWNNGHGALRVFVEILCSACF